MHTARIRSYYNVEYNALKQTLPTFWTVLKIWKPLQLAIDSPQKRMKKCLSRVVAAVIEQLTVFG